LVHTSDGYIKYEKDNSVEIIKEDVEDIYNRMDKSSLAKKNEVVLTVNGFYPDNKGNVEVVEEAPEIWN
jgi:hypothetical protein